jgi:hypothetical protein
LDNEFNHFSSSKKSTEAGEKEKVKTGNEVQTGEEGTQKMEKGTQNESSKLKQTGGIKNGTTSGFVEVQLQQTTPLPPSRLKGKEEFEIDPGLLSTLKPATTTAELKDATTLELEVHGKPTANSLPVTEVSEDTTTPLTDSLLVTTLTATDDVEEFKKKITTRPTLGFFQKDTTATVLSEILDDTTAKSEDFVDDQVTLSPSQESIPVKGQKLILAQPETKLPNIDILLPPFNSGEINNKLADDDYSNGKESEGDNEDDEDYDEWILSLRTTPELSKLQASSGDPVQGVESLLGASGEVATSQEDSRRDGTEDIPLSVPRDNWVNKTATLFIPNAFPGNNTAFNQNIKEGSISRGSLVSQFEKPTKKENASAFITEVLLPKFQSSPLDRASDGMWIPVSILHEEHETATEITRKQERTAETIGNFQPSNGVHKASQPGMLNNNSPRKVAQLLPNPETTVRPKQKTSVINFKTDTAFQKIPEPVGRIGRILDDSKGNNPTQKTPFNTRFKEDESSPLQPIFHRDKGSTFSNAKSVQIQNFKPSSRDLTLDDITDFNKEPTTSTTKPAQGRPNVTSTTAKKMQQTDSLSNTTTTKFQNNIPTAVNSLPQNNRLASTTLKPRNNKIPVTTVNSSNNKQQKSSQPTESSKSQGRASTRPSVPDASKVPNAENHLSTESTNRFTNSPKATETPKSTTVTALEFTTILAATTRKTTSSHITQSSQKKKNQEITTVSSVLAKAAIEDEKPGIPDNVSASKAQVNQAPVGQRQGKMLNISGPANQNKLRHEGSHGPSNPQQKSRPSGHQPPVTLNERGQNSNGQDKLNPKVNSSSLANSQTIAKGQRSQENKRPPQSKSTSQASQTQRGRNSQNNQRPQDPRKGKILLEDQKPKVITNTKAPSQGFNKPPPGNQVSHALGSANPGTEQASDLTDGRSEQTSKGGKNSWPVLIKNGKEQPFYTLADPGDRPPNRTRPPPLGLIALSGIWEQGLDNHVDSDPL